MSLKKKKQYPKRICGMVLTALITLTPFHVFAAQVPPTDAGKSMGDLQRKEFVLPKNQDTTLEVQPQYRPDLQVNQGSTLMVKGFKITGQKFFSETELLSLVKDKQDKQLTIAELKTVTDTITKYFHDKGYLVAKAYLPQQDIKEGVVEIAVVVGQYGDIVIRSEVPVEKSTLILELGAVKSGAYITKTELEKAIWLLGDLSGIEAKATLVPGKAFGTSDLVLDVKRRGKDVDGSFSADNHGNRHTGRTEGNLNVIINNPTHSGDSIFINGVTTGDGLTSGGVSYQIPLLGQGQTVGASYSKLKYKIISNEYKSGNFNGTASIATLSWADTLLRSRNDNMSVKISYNKKNLDDNGNGDVIGDKKSDNLNIGLSGNHSDRNAANSWLVNYTAGHLKTDESVATDDYGTAGNFGKWSLNALQQQSVAERTYLNMFLTGQLATKNLDSSEQISLGGATGVRAYPQGEAQGDNGYIFSAELHHAFNKLPNVKDTWEIIGFADAGSATIHHSKLSTDTDNRRNLYGAGLGIGYTNGHDFNTRISYAWKIGPEASDDAGEAKSGRWWLQAVQTF